LPPERSGITGRFEIGGYKIYATANIFEDGVPGEIFVRISKAGSTLSGLLDGWAINFSLALQYGVPIGTLLEKMINTRFPPDGWTGVEDLGYAKSIFDLLGRWLAKQFLGGATPGRPSFSVPPAPPSSIELTVPPSGIVGDGPLCPACGSLMQRIGKCWGCSCGESTGCG